MNPIRFLAALAIVYLGFQHSVRARWAASAIVKMAGQHWKSSLEMWKLDSLTASQPIKDMISSDAANADVIVIFAITG